MKCVKLSFNLVCPIERQKEILWWPLPEIISASIDIEIVLGL